MNFRITSTSDGGETIIRIDGRLESEGVPHLDKECRSAKGSFVLDVSQVFGADDAGLSKIRELVAQGVRLRGPSRYLQMLLEDEGARPPHKDSAE